MEIRTSAFCSLSRSGDWQAFLKDLAPDLHQELMKTLSSRKGCRANSNKMLDIYNTLKKRGFQDNLETFLTRRFPYIIKKPKDISTKKEIKTKAQNNNISRMKQKGQDWDVINKHKIFGTYRPDMLSFPQKLIIIDKPENLFKRAKEFTRDKLAVDYIVVEDRVYIEYFSSKFATVVDKIPRESRDIYKYRKKMKHDES